MEGLFFAIHPIWLSWTIPHFNGVLFLIWLFFIIGYFFIWKKTHIKLYNEREVTLGITNLRDPQYIEKTIQEIRKYITITKSPKHSWAHIPREISWYFKDSSLIKILEKLENIQFSWIEPSKEDLHRIQNELIKKTN